MRMKSTVLFLTAVILTVMSIGAWASCAVRLNELLASGGALGDEEGERGGWVGLYNDGRERVDLSDFERSARRVGNSHRGSRWGNQILKRGRAFLHDSIVADPRGCMDWGLKLRRGFLENPRRVRTTTSYEFWRRGGDGGRGEHRTSPVHCQRAASLSRRGGCERRWPNIRNKYSRDTQVFFLGSLRAHTSFPRAWFVVRATMSCTAKRDLQAEWHAHSPLSFSPSAE